MARSNNFQVRVTGDTTKFDAAMSKAQRELRGFSDAAKAAFTVIGITSFTAAFAGLARTIGDFERANSELAAVLGTNLKGIESLTKSAKDLGRTSEFTASEVTKLQISLSRLGFTTSQIEKMQKPVLNFALAMGTDLASAADFAGAALRAFGLQAEDTDKLLDVLSAATTNSALDFAKLQASLSVVAPIAKSFGLDAKETAAFLGVLSNNGFDASSAATALRNILLNLSDANGKLSKGIGYSAKSFDEIITAFKELQAKGVDVGAVLEMTDKRSAAAAVTLIEQADAAMQLKEKLDDSQGSLQTMADTMADNLVGSTRALKSAWEGFQLALEDSKGPMKDVVDALTDILNRMTDIISKQDKVTWWEAILGPISGGLIASRIKKQREKALQGGGGFSGGGEGGGERPEPMEPVVDVTPKYVMSDDEKRVRAMMKKGVEAIQADLTEFSKVLVPTELIKPDTHEFKEQIIADIGDDIRIAIVIDPESVNQIRDVTQEVNAMANDMAVSIGEAMGNLFADLATGENAWGNFANAALSAFGDMAISVGKIAIEMGIASEGIKAALKLGNPWVAIGAGVALVALGTMVKSSLANVASGGSYSAASNVASSSASAYSSEYEQREVTVNVTGTLEADGDQLVAVINNANKKSFYQT